MDSRSQTMSIHSDFYRLTIFTYTPRTTKENCHCFHSTGYATLIWSYSTLQFSRENTLNSFTLQALFLKCKAKIEEESTWLLKKFDRIGED